MSGHDELRNPAVHGRGGSRIRSKRLALHHAYLIKGFVLAHNPPPEVREAIDAVVASLNSPPNGEVTITGDVPLGILPDLVADGDSTGSLPAADTTAAALTSETEKPRKKHGWSEEARAAQAERMRARRAAGLMGRKKEPAEPVVTPGTRAVCEDTNSEPLDTAEFSETELRITVAPTRRKSLLTDANWAEIKAMLAAGRSHRAIASDFDEELEDLEFFIASNQRREAKHPPGESTASPSGVTSGATRTATW